MALKSGCFIPRVAFRLCSCVLLQNTHILDHRLLSLSRPHWSSMCLQPLKLHACNGILSLPVHCALTLTHGYSVVICSVVIFFRFWRSPLVAPWLAVRLALAVTCCFFGLAGAVMFCPSQTFDCTVVFLSAPKSPSFSPNPVLLQVNRHSLGS